MRRWGGGGGKVYAKGSNKRVRWYIRTYIHVFLFGVVYQLLPNN